MKPQYTKEQLTTISTVEDAKEKGLELAKEEAAALWTLARGSLSVDEYLGEEHDR